MSDASVPTVIVSGIPQFDGHASVVACDGLNQAGLSLRSDLQHLPVLSDLMTIESDSYGRHHRRASPDHDESQEKESSSELGVGRKLGPG